MSYFSGKAFHPSKPLDEIREGLSKLRHQRLWAQVLIAMAAGISIGLLLSPASGGVLSQENADLAASWLALPGQLFLALIQMVVIPLVITSIVLGIAMSGNVDFLKKIGLRIAPYFVGTTIVAVCIGAMIAMVIQPGNYINTAIISAAESSAIDPTALATTSQLTIPERIIQIIPTNPSQAILTRSMFQVVLLAILAAVALVSMSASRAKPLLDICVSVQELSMKIVGWAMKLAPIAVFGLLAQICIQVGFDAIVGVAAYMATVLCGLVLLLGFYLLIVLLLAHRNPLDFLKKIGSVQLLAFSTSSSAAVMPLSMKTAETDLGVSQPVSKFIVPLGATVNMDGTALYQMCAAIFLTQVYGVELSVAQLALLAVTTVGASIGSPSTPGVGIIILATVVQSLGVPSEGIALILGVDRMLDMSRTAVNVSGDLTACVVMQRWLGKDLEQTEVSENLT